MGFNNIKTKNQKDKQLKYNWTKSLMERHQDQRHPLHMPLSSGAATMLLSTSYPRSGAPHWAIKM